MARDAEMRLSPFVKKSSRPRSHASSRATLRGTSTLATLFDFLIESRRFPPRFACHAAERGGQTIDLEASTARHRDRLAAGKSFDENEADLRRRYEKTNSKLAWEAARPATLAAWNRTDQAYGQKKR